VHEVPTNAARDLGRQRAVTAEGLLRFWIVDLHPRTLREQVAKSTVAQMIDELVEALDQIATNRAAIAHHAFI